MFYLLSDESLELYGTPPVPCHPTFRVYRATPYIPRHPTEDSHIADSLTENTNDDNDLSMDKSLGSVHKPDDSYDELIFHMSGIDTCDTCATAASTRESKWTCNDSIDMSHHEQSSEQLIFDITGIETSFISALEESTSENSETPQNSSQDSLMNSGSDLSAGSLCNSTSLDGYMCSNVSSFEYSHHDRMLHHSPQCCHSSQDSPDYTSDYGSSGDSPQNHDSPSFKLTPPEEVINTNITPTPEVKEQYGTVHGVDSPDAMTSPELFQTPVPTVSMSSSDDEQSISSVSAISQDLFYSCMDSTQESKDEHDDPKQPIPTPSDTDSSVPPPQCTAEALSDLASLVTACSAYCEDLKSSIQFSVLQFTSPMAASTPKKNNSKHQRNHVTKYLDFCDDNSDVHTTSL